MAEKLFALSEDTKDKVLELIGRKPAPDKYANKTPTMREYYSRMWIVQLDSDLPGITYDENDVPIAHGVDAYILEKNSDDEIENREWNGSQTKLQKQVYNPTTNDIPATGGNNNPIPYIAIQDMLGTIWVIKSKENKFIGLCESDSSELKFTKCALDGQRLTYDEDEQIEAFLPPYIDAVEQGGYYLIDWFSEYNCYVIVAGTCAEDSREYQPYTTVPVSYHVKDGDASSSTPQSGTAAEIGEHDVYATLTSNLIWTQDIVGYPGRSSNLFYSAPTFALNSDRDEITFSGLKLNPGKAGIAVYQFVVTNCNGSCRDVYTVAFRCIETNNAPEITMSQTSFSLHLNGEFNGNIGTIVDSNSDICVIYDKQVTGDTNILTTNTLTIDSSNNIHLYLKASSAHVGDCQITFYVDDSHNLKATTGGYKQITLNVSVTNTAPVVTITNGLIVQESGTTETYTIGTVSDAENDMMSVSGLRTVGSSISSANVIIDGSDLKATITLAIDAESMASVYFKVVDQYGVYSSSSPVEQHIVVTPIPPEEETEE